MQKIIFTFLFFYVSLAPAQDSKNLLSYIAPSDDYIQYTGRINFDNPNAPIFYWPGTYIKAKFQGTSLTIKLDDETGDNYYNVIIDDQVQAPVIIDCERGAQDMLLLRIWTTASTPSGCFGAPRDFPARPRF